MSTVVGFAIIWSNLLLYGQNAFASAKNTPNIIFMLIDDLGWNDVSFNGGCDFDTPYIDALQANGLTLNNYYVQPTCTPTRGSILTGVYPINSGLQSSDVSPTGTWGLPLRYTTLPQELQEEGYDTYLIGKWHLGHFNWEYTPTYRGFDQFFGYYLGEEDYFNHNLTDKESGFSGFDLRKNKDTIWVNDTYSSVTYADKALDILQQYAGNKKTDPFFMLLAWQSVHDPNQAPEEVIDEFYDVSISYYHRAVKAAMVTALDNAIGEIESYLKENNLWNDLLLIFSTDNGGALDSSASNWPLRAGKGSLFEGGIKGVAFVTGGFLKNNRRGHINTDLFHATDWLPTICDMVGRTPTNESLLDGYSMSDVIQKGAKGERTEILHNIDPKECDLDLCGAIRWNDYKLIQVGNYSGTKNYCNWNAWCYLENEHNGSSYTDTTIQCGDSFESPGVDFTACPYNGEPCLYNIAKDPCEYNDLSAKYPEIVDKLMARLQYYNETMVQPLCELNLENSGVVEAANPSNFGGWWSPWQHSSHQIELTYDGNIIEQNSENAYLVPLEPQNSENAYIVDFGSGLPAVNTISSNDYFIVDINRDPSWLQYFSSTHYYHNTLIGPTRDDHPNWDEWIAIDDVTSYIVSPDCATCDESSSLNSVYPKSSGYYMTPSGSGCVQLPVARIACDMDFKTYECNVCAVDHSVETSGFWPSEAVYNGLNDPLTTLQFDEVTDSNKWKYGFCGYTIRDAYSQHVLSDTFDECKRSNHMDSNTDTILPKRKPTIGTDGKFCMCVQPSNVESMISVEADAAQKDAIINDDDDGDDNNNKYIELYQSDFLRGTYRITESGTYVIMEDIIFDFNAPEAHDDNYNDGWWPDINDADSYPGVGELSGPYFLGFFAGITIETSDVILDLNGHKLSQSIEFYYQQSFFCIISLSSQYFLPTQGFGAFGANPSFASDTIVKNGVIGLSSHHGIFGHFNENLKLQNLEVTQFQTHGIQLNGFNNVELTDIRVHNNRYEHKLSPYYVHMRFLRKAHKLIASEAVVKDECVTFYGRDECVTMDDLIDDIDVLLNIAFKYAVYDYDASSDDTLSQYNKQLWIDNNDVLISSNPQTATLYGIFLNYVGANVIGWYTGREGTKSHTAKLSNVEISDLTHNTVEALGFNQGSSSSADIEQDRHSQRILNMLNAPINAAHVFGKTQLEYISHCNNYFNYNTDVACNGDNFNLEYVGNKIVDIQILAFNLIERFDLSWDYCYGTAADMKDLVRFAMDNKQFYEYTPILLGTSDAMIHPGKGIVGIRFNGVNHIELDNINVRNLHSKTELGSTLAGAYKGGVNQQSPYMAYFTMNRVHGISITKSKDIAISNDINIENLVSDTGLVWGLDIWYDADIAIREDTNIQISQLYAGKTIIDDDILDSSIDTAPNQTPQVCAIRLYDDDDYPIDIVQDETASVDIHCVIGYIGCHEETDTKLTDYGTISNNNECADDSDSQYNIEENYSFKSGIKESSRLIYIASIVIACCVMCTFCICYNWFNKKEYHHIYESNNHKSEYQTFSY